MLILSTNGPVKDTWEVSGATFHFTLAGYGECVKLDEKHRDATTGRVNENSLTLEVVESHLTTWQGVVEEEGDLVPFTVALIPGLPSAIVNGLAARIMAPKFREAEKQGNSPSSSTT